MSKFKGTPGPWLVRHMPGEGDDQLRSFWVHSDHNKVVHYGTEILQDDFSPENGYPHEQRLADAQAIAHVPEMIDALEEIVLGGKPADILNLAHDLLQKIYAPVVEPPSVNRNSDIDDLMNIL